MDSNLLICSKTWTTEEWIDAVDKIFDKYIKIFDEIFKTDNNMTIQASGDSRSMDNKDLRANIGGNKNSVLTELPILLDTSILDNGSNNDIKDKDTTTTELKSTLDITSSDYDIKTIKDYNLIKQPILLEMSQSDCGSNSRSDISHTLKNNYQQLCQCDFNQIEDLEDDETDLDDYEIVDVINELPEIFRLDSKFRNDISLSDNSSFTEDSICDQEVNFDYTNYGPYNYVETMVTDCYRCDVISLPTRNIVSVSNNTMKSASTPRYYDIKCAPAASKSVRVIPIYDSKSQMDNRMSFMDSKILGRTVWDPGVTIDNDTHWDC